MINETLDVTSEVQANRAINAFMRRVTQRGEALTQALAERMQAQCQTAYAAQVGPNNTQYTVAIGRIDNGRSVTASGHDVEFLEFGAGYGTEEGHEWAPVMGNVAMGSWSETHAKQFSRLGYWIYNGQTWGYVQATRGLLNAFNDTRVHVTDIADGVFQ